MLERILLPGFLLLLGFPALGADLSGIWSGTLTDRNGDPQDLSFRFFQKGETFTGKMYGDNESTTIKNQKISGSAFSFSITTELNGQVSVFLFTGTVDGDRMQLSRSRVEANYAAPAPAKAPPPQIFHLRRLT